MTKEKFNPMKLREKYSLGSLNKTNNFSSFWLDSGWDNNTSVFDDDEDTVTIEEDETGDEITAYQDEMFIPED